MHTQKKNKKKERKQQNYINVKNKKTRLLDINHRVENSEKGTTTYGPSRTAHFPIIVGKEAFLFGQMR